MLKDHLGSTDVIVDQNGNIEQRQSFDSWGQRRNGNSWSPLSTSDLLGFNHSRTTKGFGGHEMLDEVGIVHMGGRIYDAKLGRFLQADPLIQAPGNTQSYNRYSYTFNSPLSFIDPTGYAAQDNTDAEDAPTNILITGTAENKAAGWSANISFNLHISNTGFVQVSTGAVDSNGHLIKVNVGQLRNAKQVVSALRGEQNATGKAQLEKLKGGAEKIAVMLAGVEVWVAEQVSSLGGQEPLVTNNSNPDAYGFQYSNPHDGVIGDFQYHYDKADGPLSSGERMIIQYNGQETGGKWIQSVTSSLDNGGSAFIDTDRYKGLPKSERPKSDPFYNDQSSHFKGKTAMYDTAVSQSWRKSFVAETSYVVRNPNGGYRALATFKWGYTTDMSAAVRAITLMPIQKVAPSPFQSNLIKSAQ